MPNDTDALRRELAALAASYLPEWSYTPGGSEPAGVLLELCGDFLRDSRGRAARLMEKHETEFVNCLDPVPEAAAPAEACMRFSAVQGGKGAFLEKGTRLCAQSGAEMCFYALTQPVFVSRCAPAVLMFASAALQSAALLPGEARGYAHCEPPLPLFAPQGDELWKQVIRIRCPGLLQSCGGGAFFLLLPEEDARALADESILSWSLEGPEGESPLPPPRAARDRLVFGVVAEDGAAQAADTLVLRLRPGTAPPRAAPGRLLLSAVFPPRAPDWVFTGEALADAAEFLPFGETLELFQDCYIASALFARCGARVTLRFSLSCVETELDLPLWKAPEAEYRYMMRRPVPMPMPVHSEVFADQVRLSYFNGSGWIDLPESASFSHMLRVEEAGETACAFSFRCPPDAAPCLINAVSACWIRLRLTAAENAGRIPCTCHAPRVRGLAVSCTYEGAPVEPESIRRECCGESVPVTQEDLRGGAPLFSRLSGGDALYIGLDAPPDGSPFRLLWIFEQGSAVNPLPCAFSYSTPAGFAPLEVDDETGGLTRTGLLSFSAPAGFAPARLFGRELYWIRAEDSTGKRRGNAALPALRALLPNCAAASGIAPADGEICAGDALFFPETHGGIANVEAATGAYGGAPGETPAEAQARALEYFSSYGRVVTRHDLEWLLCHGERGVAKAACVTRGDAVTAAVLMRDYENHSSAFRARAPALRRLVAERAALSALGLAFFLREPVFVPINVSVWLRVDDGTEDFEIRRRVLLTLNEFLHPVRGGFSGGGWEIGELPTREQLAARLNLLKPECRIVQLTATAGRTGVADGEQELAEYRPGPFALPTGGVHAVSVIDGRRRAPLS